MRISDWSSDVCSSDLAVISLSLFTPDLDLFDLNRVETLRGPQGTLFGSGSVGGTIRYITNQPELGTLGGSVEANRSEEHTSELQSLMRNSYAGLCLKKKKEAVLCESHVRGRQTVRLSNS